MNRPDISKLSKNRPIYLKLGLILATSFALLAFNWTTYENNNTYNPPETPPIEDIWAVTPNTYQRPPQPPPPDPELISDDIETPELIEQPLPEPKQQPTLAQKTIPLDIPLPPAPTKLKPPVQLPPIVVKEKEADNSFIYVAEVMPRFAGCEASDISEKEKEICAEKKLLEYIYQNIKYPPIARENGLQGTVVVSFIVEKDGSIQHIDIMKEVGGGLGAEAARVAKGMPKWIPGRQRGKKVRVQYRLPVRFKLK